MRRSLFCLLILGIFGPAAFADQVTLKNGDRLTGKIVSGDGKTLLLKTEFVGDVAIQWAAIAGIESAENLNLTLKDGTRLSGKVTTQDGKFVVAGAPTPSAAPTGKENVVALRNDAEQKAFDVATDRMAHPKFTYFWGGLFDTGLALTRGNSSTATYTLSAKAVRATPRDKITLYSNYIYAEDSSTLPSRTTANAIRAGIRGDYNVASNLFVFSFADYETNQLQNLDLRQVYGGGFGYHVIKTNRNVFDIFGGGSYDHDAFGAYSYVNSATPPQTILVPAAVLNSAEAVIGEEFGTKFNKRTVLTERLSLFPNLSHPGDYRFQFNSTLATQLKVWLSWHLSLNDSYISYPPPGRKADDLILSTGLRVTWGKTKL